MNADAHFVIGRQHKVCEDYAIAGRKRDASSPFVVLCDGCSTAHNTDFGSRLLARATAIEMMEPILPEPPLLLRSVMATARSHARTLQLPLDSLSATLLFAGCLAPTSEGKIPVFGIVVGDGGFALRSRETGHWTVFLYRFTNPDPMKCGAPYYLRYSVDPGAREKWYEEFPPDLKVITVTEEEGGEWVQREGEPLACPWDTEKPWENHLSFTSEIDAIAVMSDGVESFTKPSDNGPGAARVSVPVAEVLKELLSFKGFNGEFVLRRMNKAMKKFAKEGWENYDDVSVAAIYLGE